eukprot:SAG31_NODE_25482_length_460_cov_1.094183_1_plen_96_part_00
MEVFATLQFNLQPPEDHVHTAMALMVGLARTPRFRLSLDLLSAAEIEKVRSLCETVRAASLTAQDCADLVGEFNDAYATLLPKNETPPPDMSMYE